MAIHGDKSQQERDSVLHQFRSGRNPIMVATDVAARGLDVKHVKTVINYDFPSCCEDYVHRIGRTGRAGAKGTAYSFFTSDNARQGRDLIKILEQNGQTVPEALRSMAYSARGPSRNNSRWNSNRGSSRGGGSRGGGRGGNGSSRFSSPSSYRGGAGGGNYQHTTYPSHGSASNWDAQGAGGAARSQWGGNASGRFAPY